MTLAIDGQVTGGGASAASTTVILSTTHPNDIIIVFAETNSASVSISGTATGLSAWTQRQQQATAETGYLITEWYATATIPLTNCSIKITPNAAAYTTVTAFGVNAPNINTPFDTNSSIPAKAQSGAISGISTNNSNDMLILGARQNTPASPADVSLGGAPMTQISGANYLNVCYLIVSSPQSNIAETGGNSSSQNGVIVDAIVASTQTTQTTLFGALIGV